MCMFSKIASRQSSCWCIYLIQHRNSLILPQTCRLLVQKSGTTSVLNVTKQSGSSSLITLARPSVSSSLQITNRSFTYASPHLWNQLPSSFRQPHSVHCPPGSPHLAHITSSQSPPTLSSPITASTFHSRLKKYKNSSLSQILSSIVTLIPSGLLSRVLTCTELKGHCFVCFSFWLRVLD